MTSLIEIGPLPESDWEEYRDLWLEALKETPEAFSADYKEQQNIPDEVWKQRLHDVLQEETAVMVFALSANEVVGMIGAHFEDNPKFSHVATIWGAYVRPKYRGKGIARDLVNELLRKLEDRSSILKVKSYSVTTGHMAVTAYKNFGFEIIGVSKREIKIGDTFHDVYIMEKVLK